MPRGLVMADSTYSFTKAIKLLFMYCLCCTIIHSASTERVSGTKIFAFSTQRLFNFSVMIAQLNLIPDLRA